MQNGCTSPQNDKMARFNTVKCLTRSSSRGCSLNSATVGQQRQGSLCPSIGPTICHDSFKVQQIFFPFMQYLSSDYSVGYIQGVVAKPDGYQRN
jgi:hypothetical protein